MRGRWLLIVALWAGWWAGILQAAHADATRAEARHANVLLSPPPASYTQPNTLRGRARAELSTLRADVASAHARGGLAAAPLNLWAALAGESLLALRLPTVLLALVAAAGLARRRVVRQRWALLTIAVLALGGAALLGARAWPPGALRTALADAARARPATTVLINGLVPGTPAAWHARDAGLLRGPVLHIDGAPLSADDHAALAARFNGPADLWLLLPSDGATAQATAWRTTLDAARPAPRALTVADVTLLMYPAALRP